ncbi:MAG: HAD-IC family P-type ATPase [Patescibacteria group bacterium]
MRTGSLWSESAEKALVLLESSVAGISADEARERLRRHGPNRFPERPARGGFRILFSQFASPLIYLLVIAAAISAFLLELTDAIVILAAVAVNTAVGFFQEYRATRALAALKTYLAPHVRVVRGGSESEIAAGELVPGDVIVLSSGERVPADVRILEAYDLQISEAALTGESAPVSKRTDPLPAGTALAERANMAYLGTIVQRGRGLAVVTSTGESTEFGGIVKLVREVPEARTPLQRQLARLSRWVGIIVVTVAAIIFWAGIATGKTFAEIFLLSVAVAVAAIPEGLAISVTVILTVGMRRILRERAVVRRLIAAETLGSVSAICTDKTGTLTEGEMRVAHIWSGKKEVVGESGIRALVGGAEDETHMMTLRFGLLCNDAAITNQESPFAEWKAIGDSTETALLLAAIQAGFDPEEYRKRFPRLDEIPFDSERKFMATLHRSAAREGVICLKGAPEVVLEQSSSLAIDGKSAPITPVLRKEIAGHIERLSGSGLRLLAVGYKKVPAEVTTLAESEIADMVLVGLVGLKDPLRPSVAETLRQARAAGVRPIIVTGDHRKTAEMIAEELDFPGGKGSVRDGAELALMDDAALREAAGKISIYARVEPAQKVRIVQALRESQEVVAFVGDGVNDAPAIRTADVGVALASGTDVAKETADIVLLDNNFKTIVKAIEEGRVMFDNTKKVVLYLLAGSFSEILLVAGSLFAGLPIPLLAAQILWVNLIEDTFPNIALAFDPAEPGVMRRRPRQRSAPILDREMKMLLAVIAILTNALLFAVFLFYWRATGDIALTRTMVFGGLAIDSLFYVYACRNLREGMWQSNPFRNRRLNGAVLLGLGLLFVAVYAPPLQHVLRTVPLGVREWTVLLGLGIVDVLLIEATKLIFAFGSMSKKVERRT